jgi:hypothetical protein
VAVHFVRLGWTLEVVHGWVVVFVVDPSWRGCGSGALWLVAGIGR